MNIKVASEGPSKLPGDEELRLSEEPLTANLHEYDSIEHIENLRRCEDWYCESADLLAETRAEMAKDHDYYDHLQWTDEERAVLISRGQAPLVYNKCSLAIDWLTGTERRTRIDFAVHPKKKGAEESAATQQKLLKYLSDTNLIGWNRSGAFKEACIGGVGWTECSIRGDASQELILHSHVPWQHILWDPFTPRTDLAMDTCRYMHRRKWLDLDFAKTMFPGREDALRAAARSSMFGDSEYDDEMVDLPQPFRRYDSRGAEIVQRRWSSAMPISGSSFRFRVPTTETWYREPIKVKKFWGMEARGVEFDPNDQQMAEAVQKGYASVTDAVTTKMFCCIWVPGSMLWFGLSPFRHNQFPFTPIWAARRSRDGMPYGRIRGIRDAQDDLNKRHSKLQWLLASNQTLYEKNAISTDQLDDYKRGISKPNAVIEVDRLEGIKNDKNLDLAEAQVKMLDIDAQHIHDGSGVNRDNTGQDSTAESGRAILAKQQEGAVTTAELFDNLRLANQLDGKKLLSLAKQFMTMQDEVRVTGEGNKTDWLDINKPVQNEDGSWSIKNDMTLDDAEYVVDQQDFRETVRQAQAEQLFEMAMKLPPEAQLALIDVIVEATDISNKDAILKRLRKINGQTDPAREDDPEVQAQMAAQAEAQRANEALAMRERTAKVGLDEAKQSELLAKAKKVGIETKQQALDLAGLLAVTIPLAPAADRLFATTKPEG